MQQAKKVIRNEIKRKLSALSAEEKGRQSQDVLRKLFDSPVFAQSRRISVYLSMDNEISTEPVLNKIFEQEKSCFVPRYDAKRMEMVRLVSMQDYRSLPSTAWGIKQPELPERRENALDTGGLDLIIVPGVAFTVRGDRLGHGGGYYDKYLRQCPSKTVALAFREQIVAELPCCEHDVSLDVVLFPA